MIKQRLFQIASCGVFAIALGGCAAMDWGSHLAAFKYTPNEKSDAIVLISGGSPETCGGNPMSIRMLADGTTNPLFASGMMGFNSKLDTSMYSDHQGILMAMRVPPGHYRVMPYPFAAARYQTVVFPIADLTVGAGEIVYAGEIYLDAACDPVSHVEFRDEFDRDMKVLKVHNSILAAASIQRRPMIPRKDIP